MSTFQGKIEEIEGVSVDRFDFNNLDSEVYFLSHCHSDHMIGLNTPQFQGIIKENNRFIYVSHVTKEILSRLHPNISNQIKELDFYTPTSIEIRNKIVSVTPIPSGHCPGSVMFLFEGDKTILYTGDYRMSSNDLKKIKAFYNAQNQLKIIDKIYLDTTFFIESYSQFPKREESIYEICNLIKEWLNISKKHIVNIVASAKYGYEYVFMEIYRKINMPVHVSEEAYNFYSMVPEMDKAITSDGSKTRIHSSCFNFWNICVESTEYKIRRIKMSALRWKNKTLEEGKITEGDSGNHFVCYSTHASYEEGAGLINFLKPKAIEPCVLWDNEGVNEQIFNNIDRLLGLDDKPVCKRPKLFNIEKIEKKLNTSNELSDENTIESDYFDSALESPPKTIEFDL